MPETLVSFAIPTLNARDDLEACLASIRAQNVSPEQYEILVADGGSTDGTQEVARTAGAQVLDNKLRLAEAGKQLCFSRARGRFVALLDADNEIASRNWLSVALRALCRHEEALGFESYYLSHPRHTAWNRYLTELLQISDPIARASSTPLGLLHTDDDGVEQYRLPSDGSYPTGANGFVFPRSWLTELGPNEEYHEATFFPRLMRQGRTLLLKARDPTNDTPVGVHHHYIEGARDHLMKRRYAMILYMLRREQHDDPWDGSPWRSRKLRAIAWNATLLGPAAVGLWRAITQRNADWLLHPLAAGTSTLGNTWGVLEYWMLRSSSLRRNRAVDLHQHRSDEPPAAD